MKKTIVVVIAVIFCSLQAFSQNGSTIWGDIFTGDVVKTDEASREITLEYAGKGKAETFVGALREGYQVKMKGGGTHELKVSELTPGTRIRAYYKNISKEVSGQKVKANLITRIEFLGRDEFAAMRLFMKVEPSTPVTLVESETLPDADPLRLKIVGDDTAINDEIIAWAGWWNKQQSKKYGEVSIVADLDNADVILVIHQGSESLAATVMPVHSMYLVIEKPTGVEVIGKKLLGVLPQLTSTPTFVSNEEQVESWGALIAQEIEKRLKFRHKGKQK